MADGNRRRRHSLDESKRRWYAQHRSERFARRFVRQSTSVRCPLDGIGKSLDLLLAEVCRLRHQLTCDQDHVGNNGADIASSAASSTRRNRRREACVLLMEHPELTTTQIAARVGCSPSNLSQYPPFQRLREQIRRSGSVRIAKQSTNARTGDHEVYILNDNDESS